MLLQSVDFSAKNFVSETAAERNYGQRFRFDVNVGACLVCTSVRPHSGEGLMLGFGTWSAVKNQWNLASHFPYFNISYIIFLLHHLQTSFLFSLCSLWLCSLTFWQLLHPWNDFIISPIIPPRYFWVIPVSYVTFWTVSATGFNIWLNFIFSFIFQLLSSFVFLLSSFTLVFYFQNSFIPSTIHFWITCFSLSLWYSCSLWIYSDWF